MDINNLLELNNLAKEDGRRFTKRREWFYDKIAATLGRHFLGIVGPRGVGKTVLLKQILNSFEGSFYISADTLDDHDLFNIAKTLVEKYKAKCLLIDEIHFCTGFEGELKKIFDFLDVRVVFTSSVALAMVESAYDLSRRVQLLTILPFSFREYLSFKKDVLLPVLLLEDIIGSKWSEEHIQHGFMFEEYLKGGMHPFAIDEPDALPLLKNVLQKVVQKDIPRIAKIHTDEIGIIEKLVQFIGRSEVDGINYSSVSQNLNITKYKAEQYIQLLKKSFILNPVLPFGSNVLKELKVLMYMPYRLLYKPYDDAIGALREDFFAETMIMASKEFRYLKSKRGLKTPDFLTQFEGGKLVIEIGGKGKGREQFKDFTMENKIRFLHSDETKGNKRPLFMLGYMT